MAMITLVVAHPPPVEVHLLVVIVLMLLRLVLALFLRVLAVAVAVVVVAVFLVLFATIHGPETTAHVDRYPAHNCFSLASPPTTPCTKSTTSSTDP